MTQKNRLGALWRRSRAAAVMWMLLVLQLPWPASPRADAQSSGDASARTAIGTISAALRNRDFARAEELSKAALAEHPQDCRFWTLRGMAAAGLGESSPRPVAL